MSVSGKRLSALLISLVVTLFAAASLAAVASADTYVVNDLSGSTEEGGCDGPSSPCSLADAIFDSNDFPEADTIEFSVAGIIEIEAFTLPAIKGPVTIDATTLPGYSGTPLVEIDGAEAESENPGPISGLTIDEGAVTVEGLAITNFEGVGIDINSEAPALICANHLGTDMSGTKARPNGIGVETSAASVETKIGAGCPGGQGNLISGNLEWGVQDNGRDTDIAANRIGIDALGGGMPNGTGFALLGSSAGAGVYIGGNAEGTYVGPVADEAGNTIAFNQFTGVSVDGNAELVTIGGNSIYSNSGLGIEYVTYTVGQIPPVPVLEAAQRELASTAVSGALKAAPNETYFLDFYASAECDPSGAGEGQTPIGGSTGQTGATGALAFSVLGLEPLPAGQSVVTATATPGGNSGSTSEFSKCLTADPVAAPPAPGHQQTSSIAPVNGESFVAEPESGTILVRPPGEKKFRPLKEGEQIPVGTIVDATKGKVSLTSIDANGKTQTAVFYGGVFQVTQREGNGLVVLRLKGGNLGSCEAKGSTASASGKKKGNKLWGSGKGNFKSEGKHGSATVRGTIWLTEDRCDGTYFKVRSGVVTIRDFDAKRTLKLRAGKSYLAD